MAESRLAAVVEAQRPNLALWIPVLFGLGIGTYFASPVEPEGWMLAALGTATLMCFLTLFRVPPVARIALLAVIIPSLGVFVAKARSLNVAAPVLSYPMTVNLEGRIIGIDRSASDRPRVLLDDVVIFGLERRATPTRIRISLDPENSRDVLAPGLRITGRARLSPPAAPSEPGGFDFRRLAWFSQLGAVGYARTPVLEAAPAERKDIQERILAMRLALSARILDASPGVNGGFAAAILTGDRSNVDRAALSDLRASNLAHLLAISGLHMGLFTGIVFVSVRLVCATMPALALRFPTKKVAAVFAIAAGAAYLVMAGASVATQRAFIMTAVILIAVLVDRPAFTMRSVALAAMIVLLIRPESLTEAGFQMSFAATTALIATFEWLRGKDWWRETNSEQWRFFRPVIGVAVTSFVAGFATAPISAFHFNATSQYGLLANVVAVPAMGLVVMPAAVAAGILGLFGLAQPALWVMDLGIGYILAVAGFVSGLEGAVRSIPAGPPISLALIALGGLFVILWIGRTRCLGFLPIVAGVWFWSQEERPAILISDNGRLFGVETQAGRVLSSDSGNGFAAGVWLENDGDPATQEIAAKRGRVERKRGYARYDVAGYGPIIYRGSKASTQETEQDCQDAFILLAPRWRSRPPGDCFFVGFDRLRTDGAIGIWRDANGLRVEGARSRNKVRPWTRSTGARR